MVEQRDLGRLAAAAGRERRVVSVLFPFTYRIDGLLRWRAVEAMGVAAGRVADQDPEFVRGVLRRLMWSLSDESGSIGWSAPEAIGEILANRPDLFGDYAPLLVSLFENLEESYFHAGILWAIGRVAAKSPDLVADACQPALAFLGNPRPQVRGLAAWCLGRLGCPGVAEPLLALRADHDELEMYQDGDLQRVTVGHLAREAVAALHSA